MAYANKVLLMRRLSEAQKPTDSHAQPLPEPIKIEPEIIPTPEPKTKKPAKKGKKK